MKRTACWLCLLALAPRPGFAAEPLRAHDPPVEVLAPVHRVAYAGAGAFLLGGVGMSVLARRTALRAERTPDARAYAEEVGRARAAGASAGVLYALAGATLAYALVLEFLPAGSAERAGLTFHF